MRGCVASPSKQCTAGFKRAGNTAEKRGGLTDSDLSQAGYSKMALQKNLDGRLQWPFVVAAASFILVFLFLLPIKRS